MANPFRGGVSLALGDRSVTLSYSINAMCELEEHLGKPVTQIAEALSKAENFRMSTARSLLWAGLIDHQPNMTLEEAGLIATEVGIKNCMDAVGRAFSLAFPSEDKGAPKARPRRAAKS